VSTKLVCPALRVSAPRSSDGLTLLVSKSAESLAVPLTVNTVGIVLAPSGWRAPQQRVCPAKARVYEVAVASHTPRARSGVTDPSPLATLSSPVGNTTELATAGTHASWAAGWLADGPYKPRTQTAHGRFAGEAVAASQYGGLGTGTAPRERRSLDPQGGFMRAFQDATAVEPERLGREVSI
jgi:hypothetical protein